MPITKGFRQLVDEAMAEVTTLNVSHGAVGTLLYCFLTGQQISRRWGQPPNGGGNFFPFTTEPPATSAWWSAIDGGAA